MPRPDRIASLDLIRGIAVLGILTINIAGFSGPMSASLSPNLPQPGSATDLLVYASNMILFEGKMRALFTILFGASLVLLIQRADDRGAFGDLLQFRRLGWLALFGLLHLFLFWWGDILFAYALSGILLLFLKDMKLKTLLISALGMFLIWHVAGTGMSMGEVANEYRVLAGTASASDIERYSDYRDAADRSTQAELAQYHAGFISQLHTRLTSYPLRPLESAFTTLGETLPLMMIGVFLLRSGFFSGGWARKRLQLTAWAGCITGLGLTLALVALVWSADFAPMTMTAALMYWAAVPHLLMAMGYAAIFVLAANRIARTAAGRLLSAAGRMALSNYLGTTMVMTAIFYGWGLNLIGTIDRAGQWGFVLLGWALMLGLSGLWLSRFRRGPLEWLWRCLTEGRILANRR